VPGSLAGYAADWTLPDLTRQQAGKERRWHLETAAAAGYRSSCRAARERGLSAAQGYAQVSGPSTRLLPAGLWRFRSFLVD